MFAPEANRRMRAWFDIDGSTSSSSVPTPQPISVSDSVDSLDTPGSPWRKQRALRCVEIGGHALSKLQALSAKCKAACAATHDTRNSPWPPMPAPLALPPALQALTTCPPPPHYTIYMRTRLRVREWDAKTLHIRRAPPPVHQPHDGPPLRKRPAASVGGGLRLQAAGHCRALEAASIQQGSTSETTSRCRPSSASAPQGAPYRRGLMEALHRVD